VAGWSQRAARQGGSRGSDIKEGGCIGVESEGGTSGRWCVGCGNVEKVAGLGGIREGSNGGGVGMRLGLTAVTSRRESMHTRAN
jgi:hypothetical protein